ncbi:MAG TPA: hypothetical protein VMD59_13595, partial [Acidimicrobiales bacterium]|nr:hypothetical protein [Acidimicrobiales bacterium]
MTHALNLVLGAVGVPVALCAYLLAADGALSRSSARSQRRLRPWIWLAPTMILVGGVLIYPLLDCAYLSLKGPLSTSFVGFANYRMIFTDPSLLA